MCGRGRGGGGGSSGCRRERNRAPGHRRLVGRHRFRVVRLLPVRHPGPVLRRPLLSQGQRHRGAAVGVRHLCRRLSGASVRRAGVRPHRRPRRPEVHLPGHHLGHGRVDRARGPAADLRVHRRRGPDAARRPAPGAGPGPGRRVRRGRDVRGRARARCQPRPCHQLDSDHRHSRVLPVAPRHRRVPAGDGPRGVQELGLADSVPALGRAAGDLGLHPAQAGGVAGVPGDEVAGEGVAGAAARQLSPLPQQQVRRSSRSSARPPGRASSGIPASSTRCSSCSSRSRSTT